jgi:hypothetical protein
LQSTLLLVGLLLSGCVDSGGDGADGMEVAALAAEPPTAVVSEVVPPLQESVEPPLPPPGLADAGLSWSACTHRGTNGWFRLDWADGLVPEDYRIHSTPGELGEFRLAIMACDAFSIGNATFIPNSTIAYLSILVDAPADRQAPFGNIYVVTVFTDSQWLAEEFRAVGLETVTATFVFEEDSHAVYLDGAPLATVKDVRTSSAKVNESISGRLHWTSGEGWCWMDLNSIRERYSLSTTSIFHGAAGIPARLSGPAGQTRAASAYAIESGGLAAPLCQVGLA